MRIKSSLSSSRTSCSLTTQSSESVLSRVPSYSLTSVSAEVLGTCGMAHTSYQIVVDEQTRRSLTFHKSDCKSVHYTCITHQGSTLSAGWFTNIIETFHIYAILLYHNMLLFFPLPFLQQPRFPLIVDGSR